MLLFFSNTVFAHAGSHESSDCFISLQNQKLRLSGYQFQGKHPDRSYCRIFPYLGQIILKVEGLNSTDKNQTLQLELLKLDSWIDLLFSPEQAFKVIKTTPAQSIEQQHLIQGEIQQRGIYAIKILLETDKQKTQQQFLFLVGIPITKILILLASLCLFVVIFIAVKPLSKNIIKIKPKTL